MNHSFLGKIKKKKPESFFLIDQMVFRKKKKKRIPLTNTGGLKLLLCKEMGSFFATFWIGFRYCETVRMQL